LLGGVKALAERAKNAHELRVYFNNALAMFPLGLSTRPADTVNDCIPWNANLSLLDGRREQLLEYQNLEIATWRSSVEGRDGTRP
jgi:hypothetical protein